MVGADRTRRAEDEPAGAADDLAAALGALLPGDDRGAPRRAGTLSEVMFPHMPGSAVFDRIAELGPRHLEVLELVLSGCTNQEISAAIHQGFSLRCLRCAYQAKVMKTFDSDSRTTVCQRTGTCVPNRFTA